MKKNPILFIVPSVALGLFLFIAFLVHFSHLTVLFPYGVIALQERGLIFTAMIIMLSVAIPVVIGAFLVAWRFRADNKKATYAPEWTGNIFIKSSWWILLLTLMVIFSVIVWKASHQLDPSLPIASKNPPITIQVVALQWKWLFIYPQEHIATVNFVEFPVDTPVIFKLTADAPMNTFWIPSLGSQIYAMSSMETTLHLLSHKTGDFQGQETEINGNGYADMRFIARVVQANDFSTWVQQVKKTTKVLDTTSYAKLAEPTQDVPRMFYASVDPNLYTDIITKYTKPKVIIRN